MPPEANITEEPIVRPRMPELDVIRGIAILAVLMFHGWSPVAWTLVARPAWQNAILAFTLQGWAGVNLFFVLSGFLITGILFDAVHKPHYYSRFYSRRALRILPVYYLILLVILIWNYWNGVPQNAAFVGLSFIYLSNMVNLFGVPNLYPLLWSLSVEEHFYLIWPTIVRFFSKRGVAIVAAFICVADPLIRWYALSQGTEPGWAGPRHGGVYSFTWMSADGLALGALLSIIARSKWGSRKNVLKLAVLGFALGLAAAPVSAFVPEALALCLRGTLVNYVALGMVGGALWLGSGVHRNWVNIRWLAFYGYISYGLYLVHGLDFAWCDTLLRKLLPAINPDVNIGEALLRFVVSLATATAIAYLSRITYEEFFLRMKDGPSARRAARRTAVAA